MTESFDSEGTLRRSVDSSESADRRAAFPVRGWDRYEFRGFLGAGGMGSVYRAYDPRLEREVALKFVQATTPEAAERFHQEARAQARVEHPNLVKIYEVGEVEGKPYIAMQLIAGQTLAAASDRMTLEQKLKIVAEVADALHASHRVGLIHRDIKPSNVLVEEDDGAWRPYLMDFGLARVESSPGSTMTGAVLGTPLYMSPEQARGESHRLDRRADVYSLGATLYSVLSGEPPFQGSSMVEVLRRVLNDVPRSLRQSGRSIPADVDSIVLKCLRKDPDERYASARELADDLRRYLDGEPIRARPTTIWYRIRMLIARQRAAAIAAGVAVVLVAAVLGWAIANRVDATRRARIAQSFGQQVERIDSTARISAMAPLHDVRPERAAVRDRLVDIEEQMREIGSVAEGPGHYALGRGALALGDFEGAEEHFLAAWDVGYREPEVAYARGLVLGERYRRGLEEVSRIADQQERARARTRMEREYRDPALQLLREGARAEVDHPEYVEALLAHHEGRHEEALALARSAAEGQPWFYEANILEGEVHAAIAGEKADVGEYDAALEAHRRSRDAFERAIQVAPSDVSAYERLARSDLAAVRFELGGPGGDVSPHFESGIRVIESARRADPERPELHLVEARLQYRMGTFVSRQGDNPFPLYDAAAEEARKAAGSEGTAAEAYRVLGQTYRAIADDQKDRGIDPTASFDEAIRAYDTANALEPVNGNYVNLGLLYRSLARFRMGRGEDPEDALERSAVSFRAALALDPDHIAARQNLGVARYTLARHVMDRGGNPTALLEEANDSFDRVLTVNSTNLPTLYNAARAQRALGLHQLRVGNDSRDAFRRSIALLETAIEAHPESVYLPHLYDGIGKAYTGLAQEEMGRGIDPVETLELGADAFASALTARPNELNALTNLAYLLNVRSERDLLVGVDPSASVDRAVAVCEQALAINPAGVGPLGNRGEALRIRAEWELESGRDPQRWLRRARASLEQAIAINAQFAVLHLLQGRVHVVEGQALATGSTSGSKESFDRARGALERAHDLDPGDTDPCVQLAHLSLLRIENGWGNAPENVTEGVRWCDRALDVHSSLAEAMALRAVLTASVGFESVDPDDRLRRVADSLRLLDEALRANRFLARDFEPWRKRLRAGASSTDGATVAGG